MMLEELPGGEPPLLSLCESMSNTCYAWNQRDEEAAEQGLEAYAAALEQQGASNNAYWLTLGKTNSDNNSAFHLLALTGRAKLFNALFQALKRAHQQHILDGELVQRSLQGLNNWNRTPLDLIVTPCGQPEDDRFQLFPQGGA